jgi:hypothetical protein
MRTISLVLLATLLAGGCAPASSPVPIQGDARALEGHWVGEYSSATTGRTGSIVFTLVAGTDTAQGDVLMTPTVPNRVNGSPVSAANPYPAPQVLHINLVRAFGHQVSGRLDPYTDPDCRCRVTTIFSGRLEGDAIEGKYFTYPEGQDVAIEGHWQVTRKP